MGRIDVMVFVLKLVKTIHQKKKLVKTVLFEVGENICFYTGWY